MKIIKIHKNNESIYSQHNGSTHTSTRARACTHTHRSISQSDILTNRIDMPSHWMMPTAALVLAPIASQCTNVQPMYRFHQCPITNVYIGHSLTDMPHICQNIKENSILSHNDSQGGNDLCFCNHQPETMLHCEISVLYNKSLYSSTFTSVMPKMGSRMSA